MRTKQSTKKSKDKFQKVSLHEAVFLGRLDQVTRLLNDGADPNMQGKKGSPLHMIAIRQSHKTPLTKEHQKVLELLLEKGADPTKKTLCQLDSKDSYRVTPLQIMAITYKKMHRCTVRKDIIEILATQQSIKQNSRIKLELPIIGSIIQKEDVDFFNLILAGELFDSNEVFNYDYIYKSVMLHKSDIMATLYFQTYFSSVVPPEKKTFEFYKALFHSIFDGSFKKIQIILENKPVEINSRLTTLHNRDEEFIQQTEKYSLMASLATIDNGFEKEGHIETADAYYQKANILQYLMTKWFADEEDFIKNKKTLPKERLAEFQTVKLKTFALLLFYGEITEAQLADFCEKCPIDKFSELTREQYSPDVTTLIDGLKTLLAEFKLSQLEQAIDNTANTITRFYPELSATSPKKSLYFNNDAIPFIKLTFDSIDICKKWAKLIEFLYDVKIPSNSNALLVNKLTLNLDRLKSLEQLEGLDQQINDINLQFDSNPQARDINWNKAGDMSITLTFKKETMAREWCQLIHLASTCELEHTRKEVVVYKISPIESSILDISWLQDKRKFFEMFISTSFPGDMSSDPSFLWSISGILPTTAEYYRIYIDIKLDNQDKLKTNIRENLTLCGVSESDLVSLITDDQPTQQGKVKKIRISVNFPKTIFQLMTVKQFNNLLVEQKKQKDSEALSTYLDIIDTSGDSKSEKTNASSSSLNDPSKQNMTQQERITILKLLNNQIDVIDNRWSATKGNEQQFLLDLTNPTISRKFSPKFKSTLSHNEIRLVIVSLFSKVIADSSDHKLRINESNIGGDITFPFNIENLITNKDILTKSLTKHGVKIEFVTGEKGLSLQFSINNSNSMTTSDLSSYLETYFKDITISDNAVYINYPDTIKSLPSNFTKFKLENSDSEKRRPQIQDSTNPDEKGVVKSNVISTKLDGKQKAKGKSTHAQASSFFSHGRDSTAVYSERYNTSKIEQIKKHFQQIETTVSHINSFQSLGSEARDALLLQARQYLFLVRFFEVLHDTYCYYLEHEGEYPIEQYQHIESPENSMSIRLVVRECFGQPDSGKFLNHCFTLCRHFITENLRLDLSSQDGGLNNIAKEYNFITTDKISQCGLYDTRENPLYDRLFSLITALIPDKNNVKPGLQQQSGQPALDITKAHIVVIYDLFDYFLYKKINGQRIINKEGKTFLIRQLKPNVFHFFHDEKNRLLRNTIAHEFDMTNAQQDDDSLSTKISLFLLELANRVKANFSLKSYPDPTQPGSASSSHSKDQTPKQSLSNNATSFHYHHGSKEADHRREPDYTDCSTLSY